MSFFEDYYAPKRSTAPDKHTAPGRQPRSLRRDQPPGPETHNARDISSSSVERDERASSAKRSSIFSLRKSTATSSSGESLKRNSVLSQGGASRRSSIVEMAVTESESLKSKLLFGFHSGKKNSPRRSEQNSSRADIDFWDMSRKEKNRSSHKRATSIGTTDPISSISAPFGFQHLSKIERAVRSIADGGLLTETRVITTANPTISPPPEQLQSSLAKRTQKRPPPLRPKRPDEALVPSELLSPHLGMPSLRQIRSAETFGHTSSKPHNEYLRPPSPAPTAAPIPPRRSSRRGQYFAEEALPSLHQSKSAEMNAPGHWDGILPLYDQQNYDFHRELPPLPRPGHFMASPENHSAPISAAAPMFSPPLEKVVEEPETPASPRPGRNSPRQSSIRHARSSPAISRHASARTQPEAPLPRISNTPSITIQRPLSQGSDTLGDISRRSFKISEAGDNGIEHISPTSESGRTLSSWEDDIDFCYEHAAEAECNFDWNNMSTLLDADTSDEETNAPKLSKRHARRHQWSSSFDSTSGSESSALVKGHSSTQSAVPSWGSVPDLMDHDLSHSGSSNSLLVGTPREKFGFAPMERNGPAFSRRSRESFGLNSPQLPPLDLRHVTDSDQLYDELMAGFNIKHHASPLPVLQAKAYANPSPPLSQTGFVGDKLHKQLPSQPPTSTPSSMVASLTKELPPLPPSSITESADSPRPVAPSALTVDSIVAQLRSPNESPIERQAPTFRSSLFTQPGPPPRAPPPKSFLRSKPGRPSPSPTMRLHHELAPALLSRNGSEDTIVTTIAIPPSPPESPERLPPPPPSKTTELYEGNTSAAYGRSASRGPSYFGSSLLPGSPLSNQSALSLQQKHRKAASADGLPAPVSPPMSPTSSPRDERQSYTLFPSGARPAAPRRMTAN